MCSKMTTFNDPLSRSLNIAVFENYSFSRFLCSKMTPFCVPKWLLFCVPKWPPTLPKAMWLYWHWIELLFLIQIFFLIPRERENRRIFSDLPWFQAVMFFLIPVCFSWVPNYVFFDPYMFFFDPGPVKAFVSTSLLSSVQELGSFVGDLEIST